jgi:SH3-like domain-containing protein
MQMHFDVRPIRSRATGSGASASRISRAIRRAADEMAVRVGRRWPDGIVWRAKVEGLSVENMQEFQKWRDLPMLPLIVSLGSKAENPT